MEETKRNPGPGAQITIREVTADTVRVICGLKVRADQERFVAPNALSISQAYFDRERAWFRAIYADETPVGFVMVSDDPAKGEYCLWRFMIDARYQRHGYGSRAIALVIEHVRTRPGATSLLTSCVPGEGTPIPFYERLGFVQTGEQDHGELVLRRAL